MKQLFCNNAETTISGSIAQGGTTLVLSAGTGAKFPTPTAGYFFLGTLYQKDVSGNEVFIEVVQVTGRNSDALTVVRDFESMTGNVGGFAYPTVVGTTVFFDLRWTAYAAGNVLQASANLADLSSPATARESLGLGNVSNIAVTGANTGDETTATIKSKLGITTLSGSNTGDQVIPTTLPASDVSAWAKEATKPGYTAAEVGAQATLDATNLKTVNGNSLLGPGNVSVGYLNIPQNIQSAAYTAALTDQGKHILHPSADTTARIFTIPANTSVAYPIGTAITFVNQVSAGVVTIAITTDVMRLAGAGTTGSRTLAANGIATALKLTATEWLISGSGLV